MKIQSEKGFVMSSLVKIILIGILIVAIPVSVKLVQEQQILKSKASEGDFYPCGAPDQRQIGEPIRNVEAGGCPKDGQTCTLYNKYEYRDDNGQDWCSDPDPNNAAPAQCAEPCSGGDDQPQKPRDVPAGAPNVKPYLDSDGNSCIVPIADGPNKKCSDPLPNESYQWVLMPNPVNADLYGANNACGGVDAAAANAVCPQNTTDCANVKASSSNWCYEFTEGNRCIQLRHKGTDGSGGDCGGSGGVGGDTGTCNIDGQSPDLGPTCAACLDSKVPAVVSNIKNMNPTDFNGCSDQKIFNKWCNGFGSEAKGQCDALKAGACATSCGGTPPKPSSKDTSGQATACNGNVKFQGNESRYAAWNNSCSGAVQTQGSGGIGQSCCELECGADADCDEQTPGQGNCNSSCKVVVAASPVGYFDTASCTGFTGWARDADSASTGLQIDFWLEKNTGNNADLTANQYLGFVIANQSRADLPFADKNHSFSFDPKTIIPSDKWPLFFAGKARDISAFAINVDSSGVRQDRLAAGGSLLHTQLPSNKTVTCQADKPPYRIEFRVSENPNFAGAQWEVYQGAVMTRNFTFQDRKPGLKTVFVEFKDSLGKTEKDSAQIELVAPPSPSPVPSPSVAPSAPPTPSPAPVVTTHFRIAETPADLSGAEWQPYTTVPVKIDNFEFKDKTSGPKFIWAEFKDSKGKIERRSQAIRLLGDDPVITSCSLGFEDNNTTLRIKGKNFGSAKGTVKSGNSTLQIKGSWKDDSVEASLPDAKAGQIIPVSLISTDSQSVDGSCGSISALALGAKVFCKQPFSHQTDDVALTLVGAFEGGTKVKQQVSIDKDGVIKGLTAKLEEGKSYILSLKAPRSIRKTSKVFTAGKGVTNVPNFILWVGDIFPVDGGDGIINGADKTELNRQWSSVSDAKGRSGDFNQDSRVNSLDWACMSFSMVDAQGRSDDKEPEPGVQSSPAPSPSPEGQTCGGLRGIKCADGYKCQLESNDPDAMGSCVPSPSPSASPESEQPG